MVCAKQTKYKIIGAMMPGCSFNYPGNIAPIFFILKKNAPAARGKAKAKRDSKGSKTKKGHFFCIYIFPHRPYTLGGECAS